ncbi:hypothetical protein J4760_00355 [Salinicoccus sp. ID82-1]|uniref:hypothetical protein n=1 Tax=Salinicoccus sp. ID82-1 TaxID=2820269 RepID=UPI001F3CD544|nr:hypothetical protein [Salinicoccus sp. ID82-1]MCG1008492.1 hypothetical protein [Salinicoccus sp. ID82-1]
MSKILRFMMIPVFIFALSACSEEDVELNPDSGGAAVEEGEDDAQDTEDNDNEDEMENDEDENEEDD